MSKKGKKALYLIDGSGSMGMKAQKDNASNTDTILDIALKGVVNVVVQTAKHENEYNYAEAYLWGDETIKQYEGTFISSNMHPKTIYAAAHANKDGLQSGTNFADTVELIKEMSKNGKRNDATHLIVVSDGDLFDADKSAETYTKLLKQRPSLTISAIIAGRSGTPLERFLNNLTVFQDRINITVCAPQHLAEVIQADANNEEFTPYQAEMRDSITQLREKFTLAIEKLDAIEEQLNTQTGHQRHNPHFRKVNKRSAP